MVLLTESMRAHPAFQRQGVGRGNEPRGRAWAEDQLDEAE